VDQDLAHPAWFPLAGLRSLLPRATTPRKDLRGEHPSPTWRNSMTHREEESEELSIEPHISFQPPRARLTRWGEKALFG
jgi:hypothetical protein